MLTGNYRILFERLIRHIDRNRICHDPLYTLALGTDASFYRLIPQMVIRAGDEAEIALIIRECADLCIPLTFRAAGTSLSGQAVTDSVLVIAGHGWKKYSINEDGSEIRLQPGLTGGRVNALLAPYGKKIGPDPASINAAMIGGIAANNASGMCCGTALNSYQTVTGMRIILADGSIADTMTPEGKENLRNSHGRLLGELSALSVRTRENKVLSDMIRKKYRIKNTTGYSLNALTDFTDPVEILEHLMIGSEGTLGFISEIRYRTVPEFPFRASSLMLFPDIATACSAVIPLKSGPVAAAELIDRAGLRSVENEKGMPVLPDNIRPGTCALLVETTAPDSQTLRSNIEQIRGALRDIPATGGIKFTDVPVEYEALWKIRKGLFPSVGSMRKTGTTVIIEDVAFPLENLASATIDLQEILGRNGYHDAVIFGHALEGNLHFVFTQDFGSPEETDRYERLMDEVAELVTAKYGGSLKAEHGTGRNMAPFVEKEWGRDAYQLMKSIKSVMDPAGILNPGVILNDDGQIHLKNLKPMPAASEITDKCTECGFCEPSCVSAGFTLSPRQRIVVHRELSALRRSGEKPHIAAALSEGFEYAGDQTCATDGLCATECPVKIDTGKLVKQLRSESVGRHKKRASWMAGHMNIVTSAARTFLTFAGALHALLGTAAMNTVSASIHRISNRKIPRWNPYMPGGAKRISTPPITGSEGLSKVVYFPSCINRAMGVSRDQKVDPQVSEKMIGLLRKGGFEPVFPENLDNLCCGMAFSSKGYAEAGLHKSRELESALLKASNNGEYPVLCDMSPCLFTMKENMGQKIQLFEPVEFIMKFLLPNLAIEPLDEAVTVFPVCSMKKMGLEKMLVQLAAACAAEVIVTDSTCCGFAGDRGFTLPELNRHGLRDLKIQTDKRVKRGYSTSRTCEIGLSLHSGITHKSIIYLVDQVSRPIHHER